MNIKLAYLAMVAIVASCNYLVQFPINDWLTLGAFAYPLSFLVTEITNNFHGPKIARKVVYIGFFLAVILSTVLATPKIAFASGSAFLISQLLDIYIFNHLRKTNWWFAPFFASLVASFVDTSIFFSLAFFGEVVPFITWAIGDFFVKLCCDILMLIPFRLAIRKQVLVNNL